MRYPAGSVRRALDHLLKVAPPLRGSSAYRYDLVDTARQALANHSRVLLPRIRAAYDASRLSAARSRGADRAEADRYEYDARSLLSVWGPRAASEGGSLHDYANREWGGLVSELYAPRWDAYFATLEEALVRRAVPRQIDWHAFEEEWARRTTRHAQTPVGDPYALAAGIAAALPAAK